MTRPKFCIVGDGAVAQYHKEAIKHVGGELVWIVDPRHEQSLNIAKGIEISKSLLGSMYFGTIDFFVILRLSHLHRAQIKDILHNSSAKIICEKPAFLPWEPIIESDNLNIVLQLRYLPDLPKSADLVTAHFLRDDNYFLSWKGDARKTGGLFYNIWIHYLDLAQRLGADFEGSLNVPDEKIPKFHQTNGEPLLYRRSIHYREWNKEPPGGQTLNVIDLQKINMQECYNLLYEDVVSGGGIKPKDIFYLDWTLRRNSEIFGFGKNSFGKKIKIKNELL